MTEPDSETAARFFRRLEAIEKLVKEAPTELRSKRSSTPTQLGAVLAVAIVLVTSITVLTAGRLPIADVGSVPTATNSTTNPTPSRAQIMNCGRYDQDVCLAAISIVASEYRDEANAAAAIVVDDVCDPQVICDRLYPFMAAVVLVRSLADTSDAVSYLVVGRNGPEKLMGSAEPLPSHIIRLVEALGSPE